MVWTTRITHTAVIDVQEWMHSRSEESANLLLSFLIDCAQGLDLHGQAAACIVGSQREVRFTFDYGTDMQKFVGMVEQIWNDGQWLAN